MGRGGPERAVGKGGTGMARNFVAGSIVMAAALAAMPAFAAPAPADAGADTRQICRRVQTVGTHFADRPCHTRAQWRELELYAKEHADRTVQEADRNADRYVPPNVDPGR